MKKKDLAIIRDKKVEDLKKEVNKKKIEAVKAWTQMKAGKLKNLKAVKQIRREVAQMKTLIKEITLKENVK